MFVLLTPPAKPTDLWLTAPCNHTSIHFAPTKIIFNGIIPDYTILHLRVDSASHVIFSQKFSFHFGECYILHRMTLPFSHLTLLKILRPVSPIFGTHSPPYNRGESSHCTKLRNFHDIFIADICRYDVKFWVRFAHPKWKLANINPIKRHLTRPSENPG